MSETQTNYAGATPDEFRDVLWPADTDIAVYISGARGGRDKTGKSYVSFDFVAQDDQLNPELKHHAGEAVDTYLSTAKPQQKALFRTLLFAAFGGIPEGEAEDYAPKLNTLPFVVQFRHGKPDAEGQVRMFLKSVRAA